MLYIEQNVPRRVISFISFIVLLIFIPILLYSVYQSTSLFTQATGTPANISIDVSSLDFTGKTTPLHQPTPLPKNIFSMIGNLKGAPLTLSGNGTWVRALATADNSVLSILLFNTNTENNHTELVPISITNIHATQFRSRISYLNQGDCAFDDPPNDKPARISEVINSTVKATICVPVQNAALWSIEIIQ